MYGHILTSQCKDSLKLKKIDIGVLFSNQEQSPQRSYYMVIIHFMFSSGSLVITPLTQTDYSFVSCHSVVINLFRCIWVLLKYHDLSFVYLFDSGYVWFNLRYMETEMIYKWNDLLT